MMVRPPKICHLVLSLQPGGLEMLVLSLVTRPEFDSFGFVVCCLDEGGVLGDSVGTSRGNVVVKRRPGFDFALIFRSGSPGIFAVHYVVMGYYACDLGKITFFREAAFPCG